MKVVLRFVAAVILIALLGAIFFYLNPLWVTDQLTRFRFWHEGVASEYVQADGYHFHYLEAKPQQGSGTPLVLIHGLGARSEDWGRMIPGLATRGFHVYAPDLPGYGRSSKPIDADYSIAMEEAAIVSFLHAMHLDHTDLGGWSMGGWIAMKLTLDHPGLVERLAVYDSAGIYFPANFGSELFIPSDAAGIELLMKALSPQPRKMPDFVARDVLRKMARNGWVINRSMTSMAGGRDLLDFRLDDLHQPTLVVWGAEDALIPIGAGRRIHALIPNSALAIIEGCGHLAPSECSMPVIEATESFFRAQPALAGGEKMYPSPYPSSVPH